MTKFLVRRVVIFSRSFAGSYEDSDDAGRAAAKWLGSAKHCHLN